MTSDTERRYKQGQYHELNEVKERPDWVQTLKGVGTGLGLNAFLKFVRSEQPFSKQWKLFSGKVWWVVPMVCRM